ncbi:UNVERIFIED_CONTAM: protein NRT1/ PTR FAMILY 2.11 [Sesamum latifolium]|uniref:Protein NRT1/ PTR FAMILY 2.11 n=1 Tax=Sesamum latifolium TaxID=2727402 RepID=A0AAW2UJB5_9LAMI
METAEKIVFENDDEAEINYRGIKAMPFIIGNETFEKLGAIGTLANLQVYLTTVFNMTRINATMLLNVFNGTTNFATLIGAYLCDTYFGRYKTLGFGSFASFMVILNSDISSFFALLNMELCLSNTSTCISTTKNDSYSSEGLLVIMLTAAFKNLHPPHCRPEDTRCVGPTPSQMTFLLTGFGLMVLGAGAIRPCNLAFGADQFNPNAESGKRGIDSFFNWYFFTLTFAQMVSVTLVVYVQSDVSWPIGLAIPTIFMLISCFSSSWGPKFIFLDKAAITTPGDEIKPDGSVANPWGLCSMQQVEEVKCVLRVIPIWAAAILYHVGEKQQYIVFQAMQSNRHVGVTGFQIPPATYNIFSMLTLTIWVPIYDRAIVPFLRRITGKQGGITVLQRMGIGIFLTIIESLVAGLVEAKRRDMAISRPMEGIQAKRGDVSSMSALWLVPQLFLGGLAEAFCAIGQVEFFYKQFPENMRSIAGSFFFCGMAVANYVNGFLISVVHRATEGSSTGNWLPEDLNKGRLDYFYYLVAALCVLNFCYFLVCAKWYRYKGAEGSVLDIEMEAKN